MNVLAIIPARGGSKTLPRKNVHPFLNKPLIYWSIAAAHEAELVDRVIVSTDDDEIADLSVKFGAAVPFMRPAALALDDITDYPVIRHCLETLAKREGLMPDIVVQLRPTSPLRPSGLIDKGIKKLISTDAADSLRVVCTPHNNPYKMWKLSGSFIEPLIKTSIHEAYNQPRQTLPTSYWQIGTLDVIRTKTIFEQESLSGSHILPLIVDSQIAVDIDDLNSLKHAEETFQRYQSNGSNS